MYSRQTINKVAMQRLSISRSFQLLLAALLLGLCQAFVSPKIAPTTVFRQNVDISTTSTKLNLWNDDDGTITGKDRVLSCVPYMLPLLDGDHFGKYIYMRIPPLGLLDSIILGPLEAIYHSIPFLGLGLFILLSFQSRNQNISRTVRFNMQQAILIDIALIFPELFGAFGGAGGGLPRFIVEPASNFVYYTFVAMLGYCIYNNLNGKKPNQIPWISDAAEMQIGPF